MQSFSQKEILIELMKETKEQSKLLARIDEQVQKTNGRVTKIEDVTVPGLVAEQTNQGKKLENIGVKLMAGASLAAMVVSGLINKVL